MTASQPLRVLVVDDHVGIRMGIESLINAEAPRMCSVGGAATPEQALLQVGTLQPDVVVLDVDLGGEDGLALIPLLQRVAPCGVMVLTSLTDLRVAQRAGDLGANDFMNKTAPASELLARIAALEGASAIGGMFHANEGGAMSCAVGINDPSDAGNTADATQTRVTYSYSIDAAMHRSEGRKAVITDGLAAIRRMFVALWREENGVTSIEYGLLAALICIACLVGFRTLGTSLDALYAKWTSAVIAAL